MMKPRSSTSLLLRTALIATWLTAAGCTSESVNPLPTATSTTPGVPAGKTGFPRGVVAVSDPNAAKVGAAILAKGGNAIDAAAAIQFALNVVEPQSSGIGGGGFMMIHLAATNKTFYIDSREKAPAAATPDMFGDLHFEDASTSGLSVGVPGTLRGVATALEKWGTLKLANTLAPAIELAENGFTVGPLLASDIVDTSDRGVTMTDLQPETAAIFRPGGMPLKAGDTLKQPDLAKTLKLIATSGPDAFYKGEIGAAIVAVSTSRARAGLPMGTGLGKMTAADLAAYDVAIREPISAQYRGYTVTSMPPPSSGGITILQMLEMVERFPLGDKSRGYGFGEKNTLHVMIEAMRLSFADRALWEGDNDVVPVPTDALLAPAYAKSRSELIQQDSVIKMPSAGDPKAGSASTMSASLPARHEGMHTTHFVVVDKDKNIVSYTTTVESLFGSGITVPGYGFILNNELTDFNFPPTLDTATKNPGANDIAPGKRPRSSMAPTLVSKDGKPFLALGAAGGATIINAIFEVTTDILDHGMSVQDALDAPRFSTNQSSAVTCESGANAPSGFTPKPALASSVVDALRVMGHDMPPCDVRTSTGATSSVQAVVIDQSTGAKYGAADARREGTVAGEPDAP